MTDGVRGAALVLPIRWARAAQLPAVGAGLAVAELALLRLAGAPAEQLRTLRLVGHAWAEPLPSVLALLILAAEGLVAYLLVVLALRSLSMLPGTTGRLAAKVASLVTPAAVRRTLDLVVGGALLAQTALVPLPAAPSSPAAHRPQVAAAGRWPVDLARGASAALAPGDPAVDASPALEPSGLPWPASLAQPLPAASRPASLARPLPPGSCSTGLRPGVADGAEPDQTRPASRRETAPLPPWLGGGPSTAVPKAAPAAGGDCPHRDRRVADAARAAGRHTVEPADTLWGIAAANLRPATRSASNIHRYWQQVYAANRSAVGPDPDLIYPGTRLLVPPYRLRRR